MKMQEEKSPRLQVLLATYNGATFLREQLDSLLAQTYDNFEVLVRDDNSTDGTLTLLQSYQTQHAGFLQILTHNEAGRGAKANFLSLLQASDAPYIAFCDQDDVWHPEKLSQSMTAMLALEARHGEALPCLIFTDLEIVNRRGEALFASLWKQQHIDPRRTHLRQLLLQNTVTGCTALLNRALVVRCLKMPVDAVMHDWWIALMASVVGLALGLNERTVQYRQHDGNSVGAVLEHSARSVPRWHSHERRKADWDSCILQAKALLDTMGDVLPMSARRTVEAFLRCDTHPSRMGRVSAFLLGGFSRSKVRATLAILWYLWDKDAEGEKGRRGLYQ